MVFLAKTYKIELLIGIDARCHVVASARPARCISTIHINGNDAPTISISGTHKNKPIHPFDIKSALESEKTPLGKKKKEKERYRPPVVTANHQIAASVTIWFDFIVVKNWVFVGAR